MTRRRMLGLVGGGMILAAGGGAGWAATREPQLAGRPWQLAGTYEGPRERALSWALLAPNPHNRQPWIADLREEGIVTLRADLGRLLPETDPYSRQITIGLGAFLELMRMAAAADGYRVEIVPFPDGEDPSELDGRPVARAVFLKEPDVAREPLFAQALARRSNKEPFDMTRPVPAASLERIGDVVRGTRFGNTVTEAEVVALRALTREALRIEVETPRTFQESVDLFRIGWREVDANPDGIDFTGPLFESLRMAGLFTREAAADPSSQVYRAGLDAVFANADSAMGHLWLVSRDNSRVGQLAAGVDWLRVNLAVTTEGLGVQPLSQALQEYPEMDGLYREIHARLAPEGGTVQMFARVGFGAVVPPSPRWSLESKIRNA
ncbi:twin-arginine translocation pathway signal protein [Rubellimicrobium roseum]|uniref:Twin-arginine translocation pathway signal protein n=1 Tax=Rubellimicrobium roseum TaxID=687525 RepID=A0A5C4N8E2_9RHOB|nr:twin-arginine translocation pathway signal protein [Rubellimicrobium roseum]